MDLHPGGQCLLCVFYQNRIAGPFAGSSKPVFESTNVTLQFIKSHWHLTMPNPISSRPIPSNAGRADPLWNPCESSPNSLTSRQTSAFQSAVCICFCLKFIQGLCNPSRISVIPFQSLIKLQSDRKAKLNSSLPCTKMVTKQTTPWSPKPKLAPNNRQLLGPAAPKAIEV